MELNFQYFEKVKYEMEYDAVVKIAFAMKKNARARVRRREELAAKKAANQKGKKGYNTRAKPRAASTATPAGKPVKPPSPSRTARQPAKPVVKEPSASNLNDTVTSKPDQPLNESMTSMASNADHNLTKKSGLNIVKETSEAQLSVVQDAPQEPESGTMNATSGDPLGQTDASAFERADLSGGDNPEGVNSVPANDASGGQNEPVKE